MNVNNNRTARNFAHKHGMIFGSFLHVEFYQNMAVIFCILFWASNVNTLDISISQSISEGSVSIQYLQCGKK